MIVFINDLLSVKNDYRALAVQYVKYPINYNKEAIKALVRRAMDLGFYEGVNLSLA